jgi:hypothetical protein
MDRVSSIVCACVAHLSVVHSLFTTNVRMDEHRNLLLFFWKPLQLGSKLHSNAGDFGICIGGVVIYLDLFVQKLDVLNRFKQHRCSISLKNMV